MRRDEILGEKERIIAAAKRRFEKTYTEIFREDSYKGFLRLPVNNAYLELFRLYHGSGNFFEDLHVRTGRDLPGIIAAAKTLTKGSGDPKARLKAALGL